MNGVIGKLNKINIDIPDWVPGLGGKSFGFNIPKFNYFKNGGVLFEKTAGIMAEYSNARTNPEIITPQNLMYDTMSKAIRDNNNSGNNSTVNLTNELKINSKIVAREIIRDLNNEATRLGYKPLLQRG